MPMLLATVQTALRDRYIVQREIGRGAVATVYLGHAPSLDRAVAIKVMRPEFAVSLLGDRFQREIRFLSRLDHPNILQLLDSAEMDHLVFYVMHYAAGGSLRDRLSTRGALPLAETMAIARAIAGGVDYLHANNVVHRDLKPENIMFDDERVLIGDFGVARALVRAGGERVSTSGIVLGTPEYMSPEQASGHGDIDVRTDVYSLACVVHEMLAGDPPFTGRSVQSIMTRQIKDAPPPIRRLRPDIPAQVERALLWALDKEPGGRPESAAALVAALGDAGTEPPPA